MGLRICQLNNVRDKNWKRQIKLVPFLFWIHTAFWSKITGKSADSLEKSTENENECIDFSFNLYFNLENLLRHDY